MATTLDAGRRPGRIGPGDVLTAYGKELFHRHEPCTIRWACPRRSCELGVERHDQGLQVRAVPGSVAHQNFLRGSLSRTPTARQVDVLVAFVAGGGSVADAAARVGIRPSTAKRHLADLRARSGLTTEQLIYSGRAEGWLVVPSLEPP